MRNSSQTRLSPAPTQRDELMATDALPTLDVWSDGAFSIKDAAAFLAVSRSETYRLMNDGRLAWAKLGRRRVVARRSAINLLSRSA